MIDLFAGIGGIRLAFEQASRDLKTCLKCVFTSEIDKYCHITYKTNFGLQDISGDITKINYSEIPNHDILLAGFPCQPFSMAGLRKGFSDNRGSLFFNIEQILFLKKPQAFLLENVKNLKTHDKGKTLLKIINLLEKNGYLVKYKVLNAKDFGLPQNRERLIIVGFLNKNIKFNFPLPDKIPTSLSSILLDEVDKKYILSDRLWAGHQRRKKEHQKKGNGFGYSLFSKQSTYTNTLSARYYKDGSEILIYRGENENPRKLTPRECARLQGFSDDFVLNVSDVQIYKQLGNSVPINMIKKVAIEILKTLKNNQLNIV